MVADLPVRRTSRHQLVQQRLIRWHVNRVLWHLVEQFVERLDQHRLVLIRWRAHAVDGGTDLRLRMHTYRQESAFVYSVRRPGA